MVDDADTAGFGEKELLLLVLVGVALLMAVSGFVLVLGG
jgi:hypothetical protein